MVNKLTRFAIFWFTAFLFGHIDIVNVLAAIDILYEAHLRLHLLEVPISLL